MRSPLCPALQPVTIVPSIAARGCLPLNAIQAQVSLEHLFERKHNLVVSQAEVSTSIAAVGVAVMISEHVAAPHPPPELGLPLSTLLRKASLNTSFCMVRRGSVQGSACTHAIAPLPLWLMSRACASSPRAYPANAGAQRQLLLHSHHPLQAA